jgi:hypothetical protein
MISLLSRKINAQREKGLLLLIRRRSTTLLLACMRAIFIAAWKFNIYELPLNFSSVHLRGRESLFKRDPFCAR